MHGSLPPLYARVLGARFARLCPEVRALHEFPDGYRARGHCAVRRGDNWLAQRLADLAGLPRSGEQVALGFTIDVDGRRETWTRDFAGRRFVSVLWDRGERLCERIGPMTFEFALRIDDGRLSMLLQRARFLGIVPVPRWAAPRVQTVESGDDGTYRFDVSVVLPLLGLLIEYRGVLRPEAR
jgi:hypothetical protein